MRKRFVMKIAHAAPQLDHDATHNDLVRSFYD
jgi:hypothetical protein